MKGSKRMEHSVRKDGKQGHVNKETMRKNKNEKGNEIKNTKRDMECSEGL